MEETWELAALVMFSFKVISLCCAALFTACGNEVNVDPIDISSQINKPQNTADETNLLSVKTGKQATAYPQAFEGVTLKAMFMLADSTQREAALVIPCHAPFIRMTEYDALTGKVAYARTFTDQLGHAEINMQWRPFWQRYSIFFDETLMRFSPKYETITKTRMGENGEHETINERVFVRPDEVVYDMLLTRLKSAKIMRLQIVMGLAHHSIIDLKN